MTAFTQSLKHLYLGGGQRALFPPLCAYCDRALDDEWQSRALCHACVTRLATEPTELCRFCGIKVNPLAQQNDGCPFCQRAKFRFSSIVVLGPYEGSLRTAIVRMKRSSEQCLTHAIGNLLADRAIATAASVDLVVPVPMHWTRQLIRGSSTAARLAEAFAMALNVPCRCGIVRQRRRTKKQSLLAIAERRRNLAGAFRVKNAMTVRDKHIVAMDDTMTTGTTLNELSRCLQRAGAAKVTAVVAARAAKR